MKRSLWDSKDPDSAREVFFNEVMQPSSAAQHERSRGAQALSPWASISTCGLSTAPSRSDKLTAAALLADSSISQFGADPNKAGDRVAPCENFQRQGLPARVEENQARLAGPALLRRLKGVLILHRLQRRLISPKHAGEKGRCETDRRRDCHDGRGGYRPDRRPHRPGPGEASCSARTTDWTSFVL